MNSARKQADALKSPHAEDRGRSRRPANPLRRGLALYFSGLFATCLFYVWTETQVVRTTYALSSLHTHEKALQAQNERLRLEIATLRSPASLAATAEKHLQMVRPESGQIIMVK